jgi:hypothetical protein
MLALLPLLSALSAPAAEPTFTPAVQFRPRYAFDTGRDRAPGGEVSFVTHRARLGGTATLGDVSLRLVFQDVRAWGEELNTRRDFSADGIDLPIGVLSVSLGDVELRVGRDEIELFQERLVARAEWRQPGRHLDGGRALFTPEGASAEAAMMIVSDGDTFAFAAQDQVVADTGDALLGWVRGGIDRDGLLAQAIVLGDANQQVEGQELWRLTPGVHVEVGDGALKGQLEGYGQVGAVGDATTLAAWMVGARGTWAAADVALKPSVTLGYDGISGDADPADGRATTFNTLQGANHRYYGHIDIAMFSQGGIADGRGLHDARLDLAVKPAEAVTLKLDQHAFATMAGEAGLLATETDLHVVWKAAEGLTATAGGAAWLPLEDPTDPAELWAYVMLDAAWSGPTVGR